MRKSQKKGGKCLVQPSSVLRQTASARGGKNSKVLYFEGTESATFRWISESSLNLTEWEWGRVFD
jgi:hypothetical protein